MVQNVSLKGVIPSACAKFDVTPILKIMVDNETFGSGMISYCCDLLLNIVLLGVIGRDIYYSYIN